MVHSCNVAPLARQGSSKLTEASLGLGSCTIPSPISLFNATFLDNSLAGRVRCCLEGLHPTSLQCNAVIPVVVPFHPAIRHRGSPVASRLRASRDDRAALTYVSIGQAMGVVALILGMGVSWPNTGRTE